jgi:hypothetical protein
MLLFKKKKAFYDRNPDLLILKEFQHTIHTGPFKGMQYISVANGSVLAPKIVGTYERELHGVIEQVIASGYKNIVDIGSAEGYYAVGLAYRLKHDPGVRIFAYDTNKAALANVDKLATLNNVRDKISINGYCEVDALNVFAGKETMVICDIEGAEKELIDPVKAPGILQYDFLIEVHDGGDRSSAIKDVLRNRFSNTHTITMIPYTGRGAADYRLIQWTGDINQKKAMIDEGRIYGLEWMLLKRKEQDG